MLLRRTFVANLVLACAGAAAFLLAARLSWADTKLYLKDGTYQLAKSYEVRGDRVRYYSVERSEWEEIPVTLVDFDTTKRMAQQEKVEESKELEQARELSKERFEVPANTGFQIAPGVRLPQEEGVYAFDGVRIIRLLQSSGEVVTDKKRRAMALALPAPLLKNRSLVVLEGAKAAVRLSALQPSFYIQAADDWGARAELVPVKTHKDSRIVEKVQSGVGVGKSGELRSSLPVEREQLAPRLFRLRPVQPLELGEYALAELLQDKLNLDVWDFGIDGAPAGLTAPESDRPPVLSEHPPTQGPPQPNVRVPRPQPGLPPDAPPVQPQP
ncbi:MAG TPA: hypothetical protein VG204_00155 [Terriglobia bacterium]|nr:hypothetical protein [Terriglobia bacterium]